MREKIIIDTSWWISLIIILLLPLKSFLQTAIAICRDPKDNFLLALARDAKADFLITRDKDLLDPEQFENSLIVTLPQFLEIINKQL